MGEFTPYVMVIVGILIWTFVPLIVKNLRLVRAGKPAQPFNKKYIYPPLATATLDLLAFGLQAITDGGFIEEISQLPWRMAILVGIGGQVSLREIQKQLFEKE